MTKAIPIILSALFISGCEQSDINAAKRAAAVALQESAKEEEKSKLLAALDKKMATQVTATANVNGDPTNITFSITNSLPVTIRNIRIEYDIYSAGQVVSSRSPQWAYEFYGNTTLTHVTSKDDQDYHKLKTAVNYSIAIKAVTPTVVKLEGTEYLLTGGSTKYMPDKEAFAKEFIKTPEAKP